MDSFNLAKGKIHEYFNSLNIGFEIIIIDELTIVEENFYVFFYNSKEYIINGNESFALAGNNGIIVDKSNFDLYNTPSSYPIEYSINLFKNNKDFLKKINTDPLSEG